MRRFMSILMQLVTFGHTILYWRMNNSAWSSNLLKMNPSPSFSRSDEFKSSKLLILSSFNFERVSFFSGRFFFGIGNLVGLSSTLGRSDAGRFFWDSENKVGMGLRCIRSLVLFFVGLKYFVWKCFSHTNTYFPYYFSISFLLMNFNQKFANSSFFGKRKTVRWSCPVKLVKQPLQEHLLTISDFFFILLYFEISHWNIKFWSFSFLKNIANWLNKT